MFRSVLFILSGSAFASLLGLARNLFIARLLSVEDYGIAVTFALSTALVEMASTIGLQKLIVQSSEGDDPQWQAALQGFHLLRGVLAAAALFLLAHPIASFLGVPELTWAYQILALIPLLLGFEHFDVHRLTRHRTYRPFLIYKALPLLASVMAVWPLAWFFGDYQVMLYALLVQWGFAAAVSHLMAERRYTLRFDRAVVRRALAFGWPLLVNNALIFAIMEGDRVIVARELGFEILAIFSMGLTLTRAPSGVFAQSLSLFFLPRLSAARDNPARFKNLAHGVIQASLAVGLLLVLAVALIGGVVVHILLGDKYATLIPLLIWFALWQAARGFRVGCSQIALARAETHQPMLANLVRILALPLAWIMAAYGAAPVAIIWIATAGELAAFGIGLALLKYQSKLHLQEVKKNVALTFLCLCLIVGFYAAFENAATLETLQWERGVLLIPFAVTLMFMKDIRRPFLALLHRRRVG